MDPENASKSSYQLDVGKLDVGNLLDTPSIIQQIMESKNELYFNRFSIKIIDSGEGISEEGIKNLFMDFGNLQEHQKTNARGTGLGLSICKQIIEKMGGNIKVSSEPGKGTTFKIELIGLCTFNNSSFYQNHTFSNESVHRPKGRATDGTLNKLAKKREFTEPLELHSQSMRSESENLSSTR